MPLQNTVALPDGLEEDEQRYPILGHLVWYSLRDVRIDRTELEQMRATRNYIINCSNATPSIWGDPIMARILSNENV